MLRSFGQGFSYGFVIFKTASKPVRANCIVYVSRICTIPTSSFWWNFCKTCMCYGFLYFVRFPSLIAIVFIFYLLVIFSSQTRIRVNIKVVRCLEYSASLVPTQSVLRRNSDNIYYLDSFQFMSQSLEKLVVNLPQDALKYTTGEFDKRAQYMTRKGVHPYDYMDSFDKFNDTIAIKGRVLQHAQ